MKSAKTQRYLLSMQWKEVLFIHWSVPPEQLRDRLPAALEPDTYDGDAYLGVVALTMQDVRPRFSPVGTSSHGVNLRTYVQHPEGSGVYFVSLDSDDSLGVRVARTLLHLPYHHAKINADETSDGVRLRCRRRGGDSAFDVRYGPDGSRYQAEDGSLDSFLLERYRLYAGSESLYTGKVSHQPWDLYPASATIHTNTLFRANDLPVPDSTPLFHYSPGADVRASRTYRVD